MLITRLGRPWSAPTMGSAWTAPSAVIRSATSAVGSAWAGTSAGKWRANTAYINRYELYIPIGGQRPVGWRGIQTITNTLGVAGTITEQCFTFSEASGL